MLSKGQKIQDRYEIIKSIGEGGMANVYLAEDTILNRKVAVKVLRGDLEGDEKFIRRFEREAKSASDLNHPNIVQVYDVGEEDGQHFIVMEYIEGKTLKQLVQKRGALTIPEVIDIMCQLTDGISHAHDSYIIHRDIKPQNILILDNGLVKITDFGIAMAINATQLTQTNSVMGSVHYLPPEQASGKGSTIKSDIYSLGILMYELLTGSVPFKGENAVEIALKHMKEKVPSVKKQNPLIPQSIENVIIKATAKNPKNRYDDAHAMYADLTTALDHPDEKRYVYIYPENDLEETKIMPKITPNTKVEPPKEEIKIEQVDDFAEVEEEEKSNKLILWLSIIFAVLLIIGISAFLLLPKLTKVKEKKIPDVTSMTIVEAEDALKALGFEVAVDTKKESSDTIEENLVIGTEPAIGRTIKLGTEITLVISVGTKYVQLADYVGENYVSAKTILEEVNGLHVLIEKKAVDKVDDYRDKADIIIAQSPAKDTKLVAGDTITLYIPDIVETYPDMVAEKWTENDVKLFEEKYGVILEIKYVKTSTGTPGTIIEQNRTAGTTIIKGATLKVSIAQEPDDPLDPILPDDDDE